MMQSHACDRGLKPVQAENTQYYHQVDSQVQRLSIF